MANIIIGRKLTTGIVCSRPMRPASQPQLNTATTTPNDEPIDTRMARAALIGTRIERNTAISMMTVRPITRAMNGSSAPANWSEMSMLAAVEPATKKLATRSEEHTSALQVTNAQLVSRILLEKQNNTHVTD